MIQFYAPNIETSLKLPESDSKHCIRVLRMGEGDVIDVIDGHGNRYQCRIVSGNPKATAVEIISKVTLQLPWSQNFTVAVAPTKHLDRMEWLVEKLTEIGVNRIIPMLCTHSERKEIKTERLEKIAISAMKQSLKTVLPEIWPMTPIKKVVSEINVSQKFIAYCGDDNMQKRNLLAKEYEYPNDAIILIGPEGDFSPQEVSYCLESGYTPVTLGNNRLRTETAALVACDTFHIISQINQKKYINQ